MSTTNEVQKDQNQVAPSRSFNFFDLEQFKTMQRVCTMFANSELVPDMYKAHKDNPIDKAIANCMVAIEMAQRIDASPLMVMQNLVIIYGRPSWSSKFLIATVNSCGRFEPLQYKFEDLGTLKDVEYFEYQKGQGKVTKKFPGPIQNFQCIAFTRKKGSKEILESIPVTIEMAIKEGWYTKNGSKWQTMARLMLSYRAASFWTSAYAPELSMGIKTVEENIDIQDIPFEEVFDDKIRNEANQEDLTLKPDPSKAPEQPNTEETKKDPEPEKKEDPLKANGTVENFEKDGSKGNGKTAPQATQSKIGPGF